MYLNDNLLSLYELYKKFKDKYKLNIKIMIDIYCRFENYIFYIENGINYENNYISN